MYQITGKQVSFRVTDFEREKLNKVSEVLQAESNTEFQNAKDLTFAVINKLEDLATAEPQTIEIEVVKEVLVEVIPEALKTKFEEINATVFDGEEMTEVEMLETLIQIISTPAPIVPITEEKTVEVEVERKLSENEILVDLRPAQKRALEFIADWRFNKKLDPEKLSLSGVLRGLAFNPGPLTNWLNEFETGISNPNKIEK